MIRFWGRIDFNGSEIGSINSAMGPKNRSIGADRPFEGLLNGFLSTNKPGDGCKLKKTGWRSATIGSF